MPQSALRHLMAPPPPPPPGEPPVDILDESDIESVEMEDTADMLDHTDVQLTPKKRFDNIFGAFHDERQKLAPRPLGGAATAAHESTLSKAFKCFDSSSRDRLCESVTSPRHVLTKAALKQGTMPHSALIQQQQQQHSSPGSATKPPRVRKSRFGPPVVHAATVGAPATVGGCDETGAQTLAAESGDQSASRLDSSSVSSTSVTSSLHDSSLMTSDKDNTIGGGSQAEDDLDSTLKHTQAGETRL